MIVGIGLCSIRNRARVKPLPYTFYSKRILIWKNVTRNNTVMIKISEIIVVEGKHDKIKLENIFDTLILTTDGFRLYKDKEKIALLKKLALQRGMIILTDSDSAGFRIRNYIKQCFGDIPVKHAYIPEISGKERRKTKPGAEGIIGVEGMPDDILIDVIMKQAVEQRRSDGSPAPATFTKTDFYELGLSGKPDSKKKREALAKKLGLPAKISANVNAMIDIINVMYDKDKIAEVVQNAECRTQS